MYDLNRIVQTLLRRWPIFAGAFVAVLLLGGLMLAVMPRTYVANAEVMVRRSNDLMQPSAYPQIDALLSWNRDATVETYAALATNPAIAEDVVKRLKLRTTAKELLNVNVNIVPVVNSDVLRISVAWRNAAMASSVANAFATQFVAHESAIASSQARQAARSLSQSATFARSEVFEAESQLSRFQARHSLADSAQQTTELLNAEADLRSKERSALLDRSGASAQLRIVANEVGTLPATIESSKTMTQPAVADTLRGQLVQEQVTLRQLQQQFTDSYPDVVAAKQQITNLERSISALPAREESSSVIAPNPLGASLQTTQAALQSQVQGDSAQLSALRTQEASLHAQLVSLPSVLMQYDRLQREVKTDGALYDALEAAYYNAVVAENMAVSDVAVVQLADPAVAETRPPLSIALLSIVLIATFFAFGMTFLVDWYATAGTERPGVTVLDRLQSL
jgi:polysaccharide biosynthesis transport protein